MTSLGSAPGSPLRRRILVIYNPVAGWRRRGKLDAVHRRLLRLGCAVTVRPTACRGDAESIARDAPAGDYDAIVVAGGDGTVNEVVNGLVVADPPLAVIPLGTPTCSPPRSECRHRRTRSPTSSPAARRDRSTWARRTGAVS